MNIRRLLIYGTLLVLLAVAGFLLTLWALYACAPAPLPGDEGWAFRRNVAETMSLMTRLGSKDCFTGDPTASFALWLGTRALGVLLVALAVIVLWETLGREARRRFYRSRGGHVILAGSPDELQSLVDAFGGPLGTFYIAPDRQAARDLAWRRPFAEIVVAAARTLGKQLVELGAGKTRFIAAATSSDLTNVAIAEAALDQTGTGEVLVRLEQGAVRALSSFRLTQRAERLDRPFAVVSLSQLQARRGMLAAMLGRYTLDDNPRMHVAICGTGPGLQHAATEFVRQGIGLEAERPLLSILRTGTTDFSAGMLERLLASPVVETQVTYIGALDGFDRAIAAIAADPVPLRAVYCIGADPAESEAMALRWEELLLGLHLPVPPIVTYTTQDRPLGTTGMIRVAAASDLAEARELAHLTEARARAVHERFLEAQRSRRGAAFGTAPAEVPWSELSESYRDDNRAVTTQMDDFRLARLFMLSREGGESAPFTAEEIEDLALIAHARWMAARTLAGWTYGPVRDNARLLHPDLVPYAELDEAGKQKDRDEVMTLPRLAELGGHALVRERRIAVTEAADADRLVAAFAKAAKDRVPVAVLALDDAGMVKLGKHLLDTDVHVEAVLGSGVDALRSDAELAPALADVLHRAWRIHIAEGKTREAARRRSDETLDAGGIIHARA
ncbi:MAG TPA: RyR domain-containing protein [Devosia sp.]|nr:RyR domain-containing protein [Devosia sp.]